MDVTRLNFLEELPCVLRAISEAEFIAIDCEFTGLSTGGGSSAYHTPSQRYSHLCATTQEYLVVQFGLSAFKYDSRKQEYAHSTFNFYLFPRSHSQGSFLCQPSSLEFLVENGFDFNRVIREGIPFLRPGQVDQLRERLQKQLNEKLAEEQSSAGVAGSSHTPQPVPENQAQFFEKAIAQIKEFVTSSEDFLDFDDLTGFQRKLLYDHANDNVSVPLELETVKLPGNRRFLRVSRRLSPSEREERLKQKLEERVAEAAGFSQVFDAISESGKPVVGHNMLLDLLHVIHQFVCPLPETYEEFKSVLTAVFPCLVDTKVMASTQPFKEQVLSTGLSHLAEALAVHPFSMQNVRTEGKGTKYALGDNKLHEAGYDAYITGMCFASMLNYLGLLLKPPQPVLSSSADIVKPFMNKLFAFRMADMPYLNITGDDAVPSRDHVFHISFPSQWKTNDIIQLFSPFSRVRVDWIDDTSAFVSLDRRDQTSQVLQNVKATGLFTLTTYAQWQEAKHRNQDTKIVDSSHVQTSNTASSTHSRKRSLSSAGGTQSAEQANAANKIKAKSASHSAAGTISRADDVQTSYDAAAPSPGKKKKRSLSDAAQNGKDSKKGAVYSCESSAKGVFDVPDW